MATTIKKQSFRKATITTPTNRSIHVEREFSASKDQVWRAMAEPKLIAQWWGRGNKLDIEQFELKKGGHWRFVEHDEKEGDSGFEGRFSEVTPPDRMISTFEWDGWPGVPLFETIELRDVGGGRTRMSTTLLFYETSLRDGFLKSGMESGLNESYDALDRVLEQNA